MLLQYTPLDNSIAYFDLFLWISNVALIFFIVIYTYFRYLKKKVELEKIERDNLKHWVINLTPLGLSNTLNTIWRFFIVDQPIAEALEFAAYLLLFTTFFFRIYYMERAINNIGFYKGYYFTIIFCITIPFIVIANPISVRAIGFMQIMYLIIVSIIFANFLSVSTYCVVKSTGSVRLKSIMVLVGFILIALGLLFQPQNLTPYVDISLDPELTYAMFVILSPIFENVAVLLMFLSYILS